jgi:capsid protein
VNFSEILDRAIEPFSPRAVLRRVASRNALSAMRDYDVAKNGRRNQGFSRATTSADREGQRAGGRASATAYELVRNNKYAAAIDMHLTAQLIGDGISGRAVHKVKKVQKAAQEALDAFMKSKVDGRQDAFGVQKLLTSGMIVGGETLLIWGPDETGPDGRCHAVEGALLDHLKNVDVAGLNRIVQGVEFSENGDRVAYWLFDRHPGDLMGFRGQSKRYSAANIDHVFDQRRAGQTRGISWLAHVAGTLRDVADTADAKLMKEKVAACLALVLTSPDGQDATTPWSDVDGPGGGGRGSESRPFETLRPGAVFRARAGETAHVVNPPQSGEGVLVMKQELMGDDRALPHPHRRPVAGQLFEPPRADQPVPHPSGRHSAEHPGPVHLSGNGRPPDASPGARNRRQALPRGDLEVGDAAPPLQ